MPAATPCLPGRDSCRLSFSCIGILIWWAVEKVKREGDNGVVLVEEGAGRRRRGEWCGGRWSQSEEERAWVEKTCGSIVEQQWL